MIARVRSIVLLTLAGLALAAPSAAQPYQPYPPPNPPRAPYPPPYPPYPPPQPPPPPSPIASTAPEAPHDIDARGGFAVQVDLGASWFSKMPNLALYTPNNVRMKQFPDGVVARTGDSYMFSMAVQAILRTGTPLVIPLLGFEFGIPLVTGYPGTVDLGTADTPLTWVKNGGSTFYDGLDILGVGVELTPGPVLVGISIKPGFRYVRMTGTLTQGLLTVDAEAHEYAFSLRADASVCYRAARAFFACAYVAPHLYEFGEALNGGVAGLRFESW